MQTSTKLYLLTRIGVASLFLLILLAGCGSTLPIAPPSELLRDCPITDYPILTNSDLARLAKDRASDTQACNADKAALREWAGKATRSPVAPF